MTRPFNLRSAATLRTRPLAWLRLRLRASEAWFIALAVGVGCAAGAAAVFQAEIARALQSSLFGLDSHQRLSATGALPLGAMVWLPIGGLVLGLFGWILSRRRAHALVDVVEANALYGGRLSARDSATICAQTLISNGAGASVGLEAAYAQAGGWFGSALGRRFNLRRHDLRTLVGAGAGAAIAAAFGAPLTGAFYAFEIVIGSYAPSTLAPVAAACLASVLTARLLGSAPYSIEVAATAIPDAGAYMLYGLLGAVAALVGIAVMLAVTRTEQAVRAWSAPAWLKPAVGGVLLIPLAMISPQALSSGHGALHMDLTAGATLGLIALVFLLKASASVVSLGFGFRGGLFFASLFLGSLLGQIYARLLELSPTGLSLHPENAALVGMAALAASIVGGPLTMCFLVLETTGDFGVTAAALAASLVASTVVRERFGYSFSTWRLHLRGEMIRSARDVGWARALTAGRMMRKDTASIPASTTLAEFRRRFPLGSTSRVILVDEQDRYAGIVQTAAAYADGGDEKTPVSRLASSADAHLTADMDIEEVMRTFDATETDELVVIDPDGQVLGLLAEAYAARRYARELEKSQRDLFGET
ncbi:MAG: chloride channel protein [Phenylobacterium sp.]|uniref:chloride channel protein n=1 Tax=Phenylobacterium sp. TaxID=1871053 RepID=UPI00391C034E